MIVLKCLMKMFGLNQFPRKWFCNHKKFSTKNLFMNFLVYIYSRGKDFATIKNFRPKNFQNRIFDPYVFPRKWLCSHRKLSTKKFLKEIFDSTYSPGNYFATIKCFLPKNVCWKFLVHFPRKWFCNHKNFLSKSFWWKFLALIIPEEIF